MSGGFSDGSIEARVAALKKGAIAPALRRSLDIYYGDPKRDAAMDRLYAKFVKPGALAFDIGSHVGDRVGAFLRLGARVVAAEPQPECAQLVSSIYGGHAGFTLLEVAVGAETGRLQLHVNGANPTISTASTPFIDAARDAPQWRGETWDRAIEVPVTTLDALIATHGSPAFIKIDVEGWEAQALAGLSKPPPALSFEFTTIQRDVAERCLARLEMLGRYRYNVALGESQRFTFAEYISGAEMATHIAALPLSANSGDVYAVLDPS